MALHERGSLIVFDEVQLYPKALESIKQLVADGRYDFFETGSLVSIHENVKNILIPSEERAMQLNPFDFDEFLWAMGEEPLAMAVTAAFKDLKPLPNPLHSKAMRLFRHVLFGNIELNEGMLTENAVAQLLQSSEHKLFFFSRYGKEDKDERMEIDFLITEGYRNVVMKNS